MRSALALLVLGLHETSGAFAPPHAPRLRAHKVPRHSLTIFSSMSQDGGESTGDTPIWLQQAGIMWVAAAMLGPVCDGRHSSHDVLHYATNSIAGSPWQIYAPGTDTLLLETCWWVPLAFGGAGVILGAAHPALDRAWGGGARQPPGWAAVLLSVAAFVACYDFSGQLAQEAALVGSGHDFSSVDLPLAACAVASFVAFERSRGGLFMMLLLAVIGPAVEIGLINVLHLYSYTHPDFMGIPSWIPWVYAAGGPPNGALGRQVLSTLQQNAHSSTERSPVDRG
jgi:hypothetical protein